MARDSGTPTDSAGRRAASWHLEDIHFSQDARVLRYGARARLSKTRQEIGQTARPCLATDDHYPAIPQFPMHTFEFILYPPRIRAVVRSTVAVTEDSVGDADDLRSTPIAPAQIEARVLHRVPAW